MNKNHLIDTPTESGNMKTINGKPAPQKTKYQIIEANKNMTHVKTVLRTNDKKEAERYMTDHRNDPYDVSLLETWRKNGIDYIRCVCVVGLVQQ